MDYLKNKSKNLILIVLCVCILACSCAKKSTVPPLLNSDSVTFCSADGEFVKNADNCVTLVDLQSSATFSAANLAADSFYVISTMLSCKTDGEVSVMTDEKADYNAQRVQKKITLCANVDEVAKKVVKSDASGNINFTVKTDCKDAVTVSADVIPIANDPDYALIESEDKTIRLVTEKQIAIDFSQKLSQLADTYSGFRRQLSQFTGGTEPYNGTSDYIMTESFDYFGLAGDPIYINASRVTNTLASFDLQNAKVAWELLHEMSHTFDGINSETISGNWNFDKEFFANLKTIYILVKNDCYMSSSSYRGEQIIEQYKKFDTLSNGVYSSDGLICSLLNVVTEKLGVDKTFDALSEVFSSYKGELSKDMTDSEKYRIFITRLNEAVGFDVEACLNKKTSQTLANKFK